MLSSETHLIFSVPLNSVISLINTIQSTTYLFYNYLKIIWQLSKYEIIKRILLIQMPTTFNNPKILKRLFGITQFILSILLCYEFKIKTEPLSYNHQSNRDFYNLIKLQLQE
jgi:hypothetical protein